MSEPTRQIRIKFSSSGDYSAKDHKKLHSKLFRAFSSLFDKDKIYFGEGLLNQETIDLDSIHSELGKAEGFVFMPSGNNVNHALKFLSIFVGIQTGDNNTFTTLIDGNERQKPLVVVDDGSWTPLLKLIQNTEFISDKHKKDIIIDIAKPDKESILLALDQGFGIKKSQFSKKLEQKVASQHYYNKQKQEPDYKICVFCSASKDYYTPSKSGTITPDTKHDLAYQLGMALAKRHYGVISGSGRSHMMGNVISGAQSVGGWTGGSNTPHIRTLEGLPDDIDAYIDAPDIYKRMKLMIQGSDGFIIAPGGAGTLQELLALLHLKDKNDPLMHNKPIIIMNPKDANGKGYWDSLVEYLKTTRINGHGPGIELVTVVDTVQKAKDEIDKQLRPLKKEGKTLSTSWQELVDRQRQAEDKNAADLQLSMAT